jgi:hypothetical protein
MFQVKEQSVLLFSKQRATDYWKCQGLDGNRGQNSLKKQVELENDRGASASAVVFHSQINPHYPRQPFLAEFVSFL